MIVVTISGVSSPMSPSIQKNSFTPKVKTSADFYKEQQAEKNPGLGLEASAKSMNLARGNYGDDPTPTIKDSAKLLDAGQRIDTLIQENT